MNLIDYFKKKHYLFGALTTKDNCAIVNSHQQNLVQGLASRNLLNGAHNTRTACFFVCAAQLHPSMVVWAGASQDAPVSV